MDGLQCLSAVCLSGSKSNPMNSPLFPTGLQCLSAVCLSGRIQHLQSAPCITGVSNAFRLCAYPAEAERLPGRHCGSPQSPMPFGCVPIRQPAGSTKLQLHCTPSPMPFGCVPIRQSRWPTSKSPDQWSGSPMPFGCVPIRQVPRPNMPAHSSRPVSNAFRLCAYPAAVARWSDDKHARNGLQCLSAVCLSGSARLRITCSSS